MLKIGLIQERKFPPDNRVALTPAQCKWVHKSIPDIVIAAESSEHRCFTDKEFLMSGVDIRKNLDDCDVLLGIKEVPVDALIAGKTYMFFSHTKKKQPHNQKLLRTILEKDITLIDFECLEHELCGCCQHTGRPGSGICSGPRRQWRRTCRHNHGKL